LSFLSRILPFLAPEARHIKRGKEGEKVALKHLEGKGFKILAKNYRVRGGEADLIAEFGGRTIVVEVKTRTSRKFGPPQAAVNRRKFRRLVLAGTVFCRMKNIPVNLLRIDVIAIEVKGKETSIRHFENIPAPS